MVYDDEYPLLAPGPDHTYYRVSPSLRDVIWNEESGSFTEYYGDEYLEDGDIVVLAYVMEV